MDENPDMQRHGVSIEDTFAEAFGMRPTRVLITAINPRWARHAGETMTGFATSVIGCGVEAGIEAGAGAEQTPTADPGSACCCSACLRRTWQSSWNGVPGNAC